MSVVYIFVSESDCECVRLAVKRFILGLWDNTSLTICHNTTVCVCVCVCVCVRVCVCVCVCGFVTAGVALAEEFSDVLFTNTAGNIQKDWDNTECERNEKKVQNWRSKLHTLCLTLQHTNAYELRIRVTVRASEGEGEDEGSRQRGT